MAVTGNLCRVTIVAPNTRMDVALPVHVQLCELQSDLLRHAADGPGGADLVEEGADAGGWALTRLGGAPLDSNLTPAQLEIADGEELYFQPFSQIGPEAVFDDIIDAMATASADRPGRWTTETSILFGMITTSVALLGGAAAALFSGGSAARWLAYGVGIILLAGGVVAARALGRQTAATVLGLLSLPYAFIAGVLTVTPLTSITEIGDVELIVAGAVTTVFAVLAGIGIPIAAPVFSGVAIGSSGLLLSAMLCAFTGATPAESGATVAVVMMAFIPAMPMASFRVSRLPMPTVPRSPQQLRADTETVDSDMALRRSERADQHLTGMLAAVAAVAAGACLPLALAEGFPATALCILISLLMFMRARIFVTIRQRLPFLLAALAGGAALAIAAWTDSANPATYYTQILTALAITGVIAMGYVLGIAGKRISPVWGRIIDIVEVILFIAAIPLTLWVWDAYWWVRTVNG
ncbi:type VII secretion integral membrane protein EccD [Stackebrandtia soli]|uniref:type VII secretion integral membrane protein EccD n=1 Tax=Stackebrandtia soli TaxID=1892856 RepID=UPI0039EAC7EF